MTDLIWLVSIHDVMPETMTVVRSLVVELDKHQVSPLTLLVVPGGDWSANDIEWLRVRQAQGDRLAGHGWIHRAGQPCGLYDRLHRRFFSRGVAEHLALDTGEIQQLIQNCHDWFVSRGLQAPQLYVPPAWAMGQISRAQLRELPFAQYETLTGIYDASNDRFQSVPLIGFEADTRFRALSLRLSNAFNRVMARRQGCLRVAIHPHDLQLHLRDELQEIIENPSHCAAYD